MPAVLKSHKTTIVGILSLIGAACSFGISLYNGDTPDLAAIIASLQGLGFLLSKDADK